MYEFPRLGIVFGNQWNAPSKYTSARCIAELRQVLKFTDRVRVMIHWWDSDIWFQKTADMVKNAVDLGFTQIIWGVNPHDVTSLNWEPQAEKVKERAAWAQANGVTEFHLGNEIEMSHDGSITDAEIRTKLRTLATECQSIFTAGNISYATSMTDNQLTHWINEGKGDIDKLGCNLYDSLTYLRSTRIPQIQAAFGDGGYISEYNYSVNGKSALSEESYTNQMMARIRLMEEFEIDHYYFVWSFINDERFSMRDSRTGELGKIYARLAKTRYNYVNLD